MSKDMLIGGNCLCEKCGWVHSHGPCPEVHGGPDLPPLITDFALENVVPANNRIAQLERELAEAKAELVRKDEALAEIAKWAPCLLPRYESVGTTQLAVIHHGMAIEAIAAALTQGGKEGA